MCFPGAEGEGHAATLFAEMQENSHPEKTNIHRDFREESHLFRFSFQLETKDSFGREYKGIDNLSCAVWASVERGRDANDLQNVQLLKIKGVRRKHVNVCAEGK